MNTADSGTDALQDFKYKKKKNLLYKRKQKQQTKGNRNIAPRKEKRKSLNVHCCDTYTFRSVLT